MTSVAIGLFAGIFVLALYEGMINNRVRTVIDTEVGHLQIHHKQFKEDYDPKFSMNEQQVINSLKSFHQIKYLSTRTVTFGMLSTTTGSTHVRINGITNNAENNTSKLKDKIKEGKELSEGKKNGVLIGKKLADKMKLKLNNKIVLTFTDKDNNLTAGAFRIVGIYQSDNTPLDELNVYVSKNVLNNYLNLPQNSCNEIAILLHDDKDLQTTKEEIQKKFPELAIETWKETSPETNLMVGYVDEFSIIYVIIIMIALAFGIINTMLMSVLERTREIGMLTALGMNRKKVFLLILSETVLLTFVGVPLGILASWLATIYFSKAGIDISSFSEAAMSGFGFSSIIYPEFPSDSLPKVLIIIIITALVSALFPSLKAIKLQPADALRQ